MRPFFLGAILLCLTGSAQAQFPFGAGNTGGPRPIQVKLVSETQVIVPGQAFYLGLEMTHEPGWNSYWTNPGTGKPTEMTWDLPAGFAVGERISPIPKVKEDVIGNIHYFDETMYHLYQVTPPEELSADAVSLKGTASWLQCSPNTCEQAHQDVEITFTVGEAPRPDEEMDEAIDLVLGQQAQIVDAWTVTGNQTAETYTFTLTPAEDANPDPGAIYVFEENRLLEAATPQRSQDGENIVLSLPKATDEEITELRGYFYARNGWLKDGGAPWAMTLRAVQAEKSAEGEEPTFVTLSGETEGPLSIWKALLFAFIGGMILNIMPCVFPVLSIKILGFVEQAGAEPRKVKQHGLMFAWGVLVSCLVLAAIVIGINHLTGQQSGWGSHLGYPQVTAVIVIVMFVMGLNFAGLFEMGTSLVKVGGNLMRKKGFTGSFFSGVLTTVVATPCSGPFLASVIGYAFSQPMAVALLLFTVFALGVSFPYVALSFSPQLIRKLPAPGPWMETFKHAMAFPMFGAALFFLYAFGGSTGVIGVTWLLAGLLLMAAGLWAYGRWCTPARAKTTRYGGLAAAGLMSVLGLYASYGATKHEARSFLSQAGNLQWEEWSPQRVRDLREEGRMLFVDFTANW